MFSSHLHHDKEEWEEKEQKESKEGEEKELETEEENVKESKGGEEEELVEEEEEEQEEEEEEEEKLEDHTLTHVQTQIYFVNGQTQVCMHCNRDMHTCTHTHLYKLFVSYHPNCK